MKRIEKELLLIDLENANINVERKYKKLSTIVTYYLDEEKPEMDIKAPTPTKEEEKEDSTEVDIHEKEEGENQEKEDEKEEKAEDNEAVEDDTVDHKPDLLPQDIKTIYRKIMMKTHPDKIRNSSHAKEYKKYYEIAVEAKNANDKAEIMYVAYKLDIPEVFEVDDEHFGNVRYKIKLLEMQAEGIDTNPFWIWYHTQNEQLKRIMIQQITKMHGKRKKR